MGENGAGDTTRGRRKASSPVRSSEAAPDKPVDPEAFRPFVPAWQRSTGSEDERLLKAASLALFGKSCRCLLRCTDEFADLVRNAMLEVGSRKELRRKVERIGNLAQELSTCLADADVVTYAPLLVRFFEIRSASSGQVLGRASRLAKEISRRIGAGAGQGSAAEALGHPSSVIQTAAVVAEVWCLRHGHEPTNLDLRAQAACAEIWLLAGGKVTAAEKRGDVDKGSSFARHIRTVTAASAALPPRIPRGEQWKVGSPGTRSATVSLARERARVILARYAIEQENPQFRTVTSAKACDL